MGKQKFFIMFVNSHNRFLFYSKIQHPVDGYRTRNFSLTLKIQGKVVVVIDVRGFKKVPDFVTFLKQFIVQ